MYIVDVARGLVLFKTSPNRLVHLTTIVRTVVNECVLASRRMPNGVTVEIVLITIYLEEIDVWQ
jgi:hypothetical protein